MVNNSYLLGVDCWGILIANIICFWSILLLYKEHVIDMFLLRDNTIRIKEGQGYFLQNQNKQMVPQLGIFIILYFTELISSSPPSSSPCSCSPFTHLCSLDWKHPSGTYIQTRICLASKSLLIPLLQAIFPNFFLKTKERFPEGRGQGGELEETEYFFLDLYSEIFRFWFFLPSMGAGVPCFMGTYSLPLCV